MRRCACIWTNARRMTAPWNKPGGRDKRLQQFRPKARGEAVLPYRRSQRGLSNYRLMCDKRPHVCSTSRVSTGPFLTVPRHFLAVAAQKVFFLLPSLPSEIEQLPDLQGYLKFASTPSWVRG
jgi:hypothetical protein